MAPLQKELSQSLFMYAILTSRTVPDKDIHELWSREDSNLKREEFLYSAMGQQIASLCHLSESEVLV